MPSRARHHVIQVRSGNGGTIVSRGSSVGNVPIVLGRTDRRRHQGFDNVHNRGRQCAQAHHPTTLRARNLMMITCRGWRFVSDGYRAVEVLRLVEMSLAARMFVHMAVPMDVLRSALAMFMHVHNAQTVIFFSKTWRRPRPIGKRKGNARRQHAKQIDQGGKPPGPQSLRFAQSYEHPALQFRY